MLAEVKNWVILNKLKTGLLIFNLALFGVVIFFYHLGMLPIAKTGDLIFWLILIFALALYRPGWAFLFFTGALVLENISLTSSNIGITLRIYQALGALIIVAIIIRATFKKTGLIRLGLKIPDYLMLVFLGSSLLSALFSAEKGASLKITLIILSFVALYFLTRAYIQDQADLKKIIPFFLVSSLGVVLYGILQNIFFSQGFSFHGKVMPGRPNATFTEPDWLGIYLVLLLAVIYSIAYYLSCLKQSEESLEKSKVQSLKSKFIIKNSKLFLLYFYLIFVYILLILTVSRSAWLGAGFVTLVFLKAILTDFSWHWGNWRWKMFLQQAVFIVCSGVFSLLIIYSFHLTNFQLFNRAASSGGLQKITVACILTDCAISDCIDAKELKPGSAIKNIEELGQYGCRHINLEAIQKEKEQGKNVFEVYRTDPNVSIRGQIFQKSWAEIKKYPILGIGYGAIPVILGQDERPARIATQSVAGGGVNLNSSNIFLEVWLGSGLIGLLAFILIWLNAIMVFIKRFWRAESQSEKSFALFVLLGIFALLVPNLFNAGIFLMILWFFWGIVPIKFNEK